MRLRLNPTERFGLRLTLVGIAIVLVAVPFATLLFQVLAKGPLTRADGRIANAANEWVSRHPVLVDVLQAVTDLGKPVVLVLLVVLGLAYVWHAGSRRAFVFLLVTPLAGGIIDSLVKVAVNRPRPIVDHPVATALGKSFPSGHAMSSTVTYGALLLVLLPVVPRAGRRAAVVATIVLVLAIGASRELLGVHFVSDVIGGWVLGLAWLVGAAAVFEFWRKEEGRPPVEPLEEGVEPEVAS
jgi:undecaprenyl-diphosphatase